MKNILILASGSIARNFIAWISKNRVAENHYYVTCYNNNTTPTNIGKNVTILDADPTSYFRLSSILSEVSFNNIFIVIEDIEDTRYTLKNLSLIQTKSRIILVNQWGDKDIGSEVENISVIHSDALMAAHLYDQLPNVPLVAQNVGLGTGEIMEVHIPFGSSYAYRHIGSIVQRKWKIAALYRDEKQILPTHATMIRPNDRLLIVGKPLVLNGIYKTINKRMGLFPEPYGKDIYLILDMHHDNDMLLIYIKESIYLREKLEKKSLFIRVINPNDFALLEKIKAFESEHVSVSIYYDNTNIQETIEYDIHLHDIGLIMNSVKAFSSDNLRSTLYSLKKLVYLFGDKHLFNIKSCVVLMSESAKMESISATAFDISESLDLNFILGDYDPENEFESRKIIIEHYETLAHIFNMKIDIVQKVSNPIRELRKMKEILQVAPFEKDLNSDNLITLFSTKIQDFILTTNTHPKLLVPFERTETKEEIKF